MWRLLDYYNSQLSVMLGFPTLTWPVKYGSYYLVLDSERLYKSPDVKNPVNNSFPLYPADNVTFYGTKRAGGAIAGRIEKHVMTPLKMKVISEAK